MGAAFVRAIVGPLRRSDGPGAGSSLRVRRVGRRCTTRGISVGCAVEWVPAWNPGKRRPARLAHVGEGGTVHKSCSARTLTRKTSGHRPFAASVMLLGLVGCGRISIAPSCPPDLRVGDGGTVEANVQDPGAIPKYLWQVIPSDMATLDEPESPTTGRNRSSDRDRADRDSHPSSPRTRR